MQSWPNNCPNGHLRLLSQQEAKLPKPLGTGPGQPASQQAARQAAKQASDKQICRQTDSSQTNTQTNRCQRTNTQIQQPQRARDITPESCNMNMAGFPHSSNMGCLSCDLQHCWLVCKRGCRQQPIICGCSGKKGNCLYALTSALRFELAALGCFGVTCPQSWPRIVAPVVRTR